MELEGVEHRSHGLFSLSLGNSPTTPAMVAAPCDAECGAPGGEYGDESNPEEDA